MTLNLEFSCHKTRQALLQLHVNDQLVINCTDSCHSCLMLIIVRHEYSMLKLTVGNTTVFHGRYLLFHTVGPIRSHSSHIFSSRAVKLPAFARRVWRHAPPPKKIFKNGAISCVLRAIFNHFHGKKSSQKIINKHEFFH